MEGRTRPGRCEPLHKHSGGTDVRCGGKMSAGSEETTGNVSLRDKVKLKASTSPTWEEAGCLWDLNTRLCPLLRQTSCRSPLYGF